MKMVAKRIAIQWTCKCGHEWTARVLGEGHGANCPSCRRHVIPFASSLAAKCPDLAKEWSPRNDFEPTEVRPFSKRMAWWKCGQCGHEWKKRIVRRKLSGKCPKCERLARKALKESLKREPPIHHCWSKKDREARDLFLLRKAKAGHNLAAKRPDLAAEWSPRNTISPSEVTPGTKRYVWWWCKACGYEWKSMINNRNRGFGKCPRCRGSVASETNNLAVKRPDLVAEWSPRNTLKPTEVRCGDKTKMWWVCKVCGHEWEKEINLRCHAEIGCPECRVTKRVSGGNSLASFPHLVAEWSPRNVLSPSRVPPKRTTNYWWVCGKCGHEWEATPGNRTKGSGCPECVRKERVARFKRFAAMRRKGNDQGIQEWIAGKLLRFNQRKEQEHEQEIQERSA